MSLTLDNLAISNCIGNANIIIDDTELTFSEYEKINSNILTQIFSGEKSTNVVIHPGGDVVFYVYLISAAITQYMRNMDESTNSLLENLREGDLVEIDGARARFRGVTKLLGNEQDSVRLEYADGTTYLEIDRIYRVQPYNGTATKLSKMPTKQSNRKSKTKDVISNILNIDKTELASILKYSTLIVAPKQRIFNLVKRLQVNDLECSYDFTSIFSCAYYPGVDTLYNFPGNSSNGEPLLKFVSKISTAKELILNNKENIKSVIIFGEEMYQSSLHELEQIINRKAIHDTTIVLEWSSIKTIEYILKEEYNCNLYAWNEQAFLNNINLFEKKYFHNDADVLKAQDEIINNYMDRRINSCVVECSVEFADRLIETRRILRSLTTIEVEHEDKDEFIRIAYSLAILFEKSCFPLRYLEKLINDEHIVAVSPLDSIERLDNLKQRLLSRVLPSSLKNELDNVIFNLSIIREMIMDENPKWAKINEVMGEIQFKHAAIVLPKLYYVNVLENNITERNLLHGIDVLTISKFKPERIYDEVVFTGFYENKNFDIFNNCYANKMTFLLYPTELGLFKWKKQQNERILSQITKRNLLAEEDNNDEIELKHDEYTKQNDDIYLTVQLDQVMAELVQKHANKFENNYDSLSRVERVESIRTVLFETGEKAFFTKYFKPSIIDRDNESIVDKAVEELVVGDEIVFIKNEINVEKDIIESIINKMMENEDFRKQYDDCWNINGIWRSTLKRYMFENKCSEEYISLSLLEYGISRNPYTIAYWVRSNKIVGPTEEEVYDALALITEDKYFIEHSKEVYLACNEIRKLQTRLKKHLAKSIISTMVNDEKSDFDLLVESTVGDLSSMANVVQIEQIFNNKIDVPISITNKLIDD